MSAYESDPRTYPERARKAFLARLAPLVAREMTAAEALDSIAIAARFASVLPIDPGGIGGPATMGGRQPEGYWFKRAGRPSRALGFLESPSMSGDARPSTLVVQVAFEEPDSQTPKAVRSARLGFRIPWNRARKLFGALFAQYAFPFVLLSDDEAFGSAVSTYVGYLPDDLDAGETVYEVARWRPRT